MNSGVQVFGIIPSPEVSLLILKRADKEKRMADQIILELIQKGLEHERLCEEKPDHVRTKG